MAVVKGPSRNRIAAIVVGGVAAVCALCLGISGVLGLVDDGTKTTTGSERTAAAALAVEPTSSPAAAVTIRTSAPTSTPAVRKTPVKPSPTTTAPRTTKASPKPKPKPAPTSRKPASNCNPNYSPCVPNDPVDVDCAGGSGNGPSYVQGPVRVIGYDVYDLDRDGDGVACD
ncbi:hypothetical protein [Luedemannella helvata]|uniref:hypothetical protein n=1 Tax=Luedemannella helvata TaxID=349315 RepID=UPI0031D6732D